MHYFSGFTTGVDMNWEVMGVVAEVVGAAAVIITLVYLATQIRQNTNQLKGEAVIAINNAEFELDKELRGDRELLSSLLRGLASWDSLNPNEQARTHLFFHSHTRWCETCWTLWTRGALEEETYDSRERFIVSLLGSPEGGQIWWNHWKTIFDPRFVERLDRKFIEAGPKPSVIQEATFYDPKHWQN